MNAYLLLDREGVAIASACGVCSTVVQGSSEPMNPMLFVSEACCRPVVCLECQQPVPLEESRYIQLHNACRKVRAQRKLAEAPLVPWSSGLWVFCDCCDEFFGNEDDFLEAHEASLVDPERVWACEEVPPLNLDARRILETELDQHHEDAYEELVDVPGLQAMLDAWCKMQTLKSYQPSGPAAVDVSKIFEDRRREVAEDSER